MCVVSIGWTQESALIRQDYLTGLLVLGDLVPKWLRYAKKTQGATMMCSAVVTIAFEWRCARNSFRHGHRHCRMAAVTSLEQDKERMGSAPFRLRPLDQKEALVR
jgi:hypothetical protein